jgi:hypothetical protein
MTTQYAQNAHTQARGDMLMYGYIRHNTQQALYRLGYDNASVSHLASEIASQQCNKGGLNQWQTKRNVNLL